MNAASVLRLSELAHVGRTAKGVAEHVNCPNTWLVKRLDTFVFVLFKRDISGRVAYRMFDAHDPIIGGKRVIIGLAPCDNFVGLRTLVIIKGAINGFVLDEVID